VPVPVELDRLATRCPEMVLCFVRGRNLQLPKLHKIMTSLPGEGSHLVAQEFLRAWGVHEQVVFVHDWQRLVTDADYEMDSDVDAVLVVKDPGDARTLAAARRLTDAGFRLVAPLLGARASKLEFLRETRMPAAYLRLDPPVPAKPIVTYQVSTYLVARPRLPRRLLHMAAQMMDPRPVGPSSANLQPSAASTSEMLQGAEAFLGILAYILLAFLALLGMEMLTYRPRFNELDSLISLISMHQSNKDVLGIQDPTLQSANLLYLSSCSDLLGLISVIAGYYSQENASLLYNNQLSIIHARSSSLKLNIQLKILHALLGVSLPSQSMDAIHEPGTREVRSEPVTPAASPDPKRPSPPNS
ncbi:MAG TPA: hypothetical protein VIY86_13220, partial [Pirellulaceae bacterium]